MFVDPVTKFFTVSCQEKKKQKILSCIPLLRKNIFFFRLGNKRSGQK